MSSEFAEDVYAILVEEVDADPRHESSFLAHWPECREYRFIGNQGFGGKVWAAGTVSQVPYVTCYPEDDNPVRKAARDRANSKLVELSTQA
jgi:hypothetical protein